MIHSSSGNRWCLPAGIGLGLALLSGDASAAGFFESLFGSRPAEPAYTQPAAPLPYAAPSVNAGATLATPPVTVTVTPPAAPGPSVNFCVRLCDGRYFPVQQHANMTPVQTCAALCPAAKVKVFHGADAVHARANDGTRYDDLDNAYVYRKQVVSNCTCNGKTPFGLAQINVASDPTLRPGDMIATKSGAVTFTGSVAQLRAPDKTAPRNRVAADNRASR